eukprot:TRINITY_DN22637_c0_g1_i1.p1 TRINITY_DN22637_c0_g1~~TRINITY_DN22637_c0_g1_i1.p1  ORF type:complete len:560 (+),score=86.12 TRINITY_DN22637_c0_g1_i1:60-1739(+)
MGLIVSSEGCCTDRNHQVRKQSRPLSICYQDFRRPAQAAQSGGVQAKLFRLVPVVGSNTGTGSTDASSKRPSLVTGNGQEWLGKDVNGSFNEVDFYNEVMHLRRLQQQDPPLQPVPVMSVPATSRRVSSTKGVMSAMNEGGPWRIFDFMVPYHGLSRACTCTWIADGKERQRTADLMVFRSPFEGLARPRMLNLELGPRNLALQARHDNELATGMLACQESISVDGFLGPPASIPAEAPTLDMRGWSWGDFTQPRAKRLPLQKLQVVQALNALVDLRAPIAEEQLWLSEEAGCSGTPAARASGIGVDSFRHRFLGAAEYAELALLAMMRELTKLLRACEEVGVPQKWVQSSLALLIEVGVAPPRSGPILPETWVSSRVKLQIYGWSKSRLSLPGGISEDEQQDNELPWKIYQHHIGRVLWESARLYFHSFCAQEWTELQVDIFEVSLKSDTLIGSANLKLQKSAVETWSLPLQLGDQPVLQDDEPTQVVLTVTFMPCPEPSNFVGLWQVRVDQANHLPKATPSAAGSSSSATSVYAAVTASECTSLGSRRTQKRTREVQ